MDWSHTALQPDFLVGVFWAFYRMPEEKRNWPAIKAALARCVVDFGKLDRLLDGRTFLLGEKLSLADPNVREKLAEQGLTAVGNSPEQFRDYIAAETAKWAKVIKDAGIQTTR